MQIALQLPQLDQPGQLALTRGLDLAAVFAQLGRDERQTERAIHIGFGRTQGLAAVLAQQGMFAERQAARLSQLTQPDVVILAAGEVL